MELYENPTTQPAPAQPKIWNRGASFAILSSYLRRGAAPAPDHDSLESVRIAKVREEQALLIQWAKENKKLTKTIPEGDGSGGEHIVHLNTIRHRYIKVTSKNCWGYGIALGSHSRGATPSEYLDRLSLQNELFSDDIQLDAIAVRDGFPVIITSQPLYVGIPTAEKEIIQLMCANDYKHLAPGTFYSKEDGLLVFDVHPRNALRDPTGTVHVFDPVVQRVNEDFAAYIEEYPICMRAI